METNHFTCSVCIKSGSEGSVLTETTLKSRPLTYAYLSATLRENSTGHGEGEKSGGPEEEEEGDKDTAGNFGC